MGPAGASCPRRFHLAGAAPLQQIGIGGERGGHEIKEDADTRGIAQIFMCQKPQIQHEVLGKRGGANQFRIAIGKYAG